MKVCQLSTAHPLNDIRVFHKACKSLAQAGHDVTLIIKHDKNEIIDGVRIIALPEAGNRFQRMFCLTVKALYYAWREKADVYHFHVLELIPAGIVLKLLGNKVIFDVHENFPQQILNKEWLGPVFVRRIVAFGIGIIECLSKIFFDVIIVARPDIAKHWNSNKVKVIINAAVLKTIDEAPEISIQKQKPVIIYAGGLTRIRGIKEMVQAMEIVGDRAQLWLLGPWDRESFRIECESLLGWKHVEYLGYKSVQDVFSYMKKSNIAIVTFLPVPNHLTTLPNKPFEYMACHLPVIMSDFDYWQKIFADCALFVDPGSAEEIADSINELLDNPELAVRLANNGRTLVEDKYSWEVESEKLFEIYSGLQKR